MKSMIVIETKDYGNGISGGAISYFSKCDDCGKIWEVTHSDKTICDKCSDRKER